MTDTMHTNGHQDHAQPVLTVRQRIRAARTVIEAAADDLLDRHDGNQEAAYIAVRELFAGAETLLVAPSDAREFLDHEDRNLIASAIAEARNLTGADPALDPEVRQMLSHVSAATKPEVPARFKRGAEPATAPPAPQGKGGKTK